MIDAIQNEFNFDEKNDEQVIIFKKTSDPFISAGIIGLYKYCQKRKKEKNDLEFEILDNQLKIKSNNLEKVLKELYYDMGKEIYDTSTKKQKAKNEGFYYDENKDDFIRFPKVKTTGFASLIHDAQPTPLGKFVNLNDKKKNGKVIQKGLESINNKLYQRIIEFSKKHRIVLGKKIWFNDRNTATPNLEKMNIEKGNQQCFICGKSYKKTYVSKSYSPFIGGTSAPRNFVSMTKGTEKICWKCFYLQRFSPLNTFYYSDFKNNKMNIFIFINNSLIGMKKMHLNFLRDFLYPRDVLIDNNYSRNFSIYNFEKTDTKIYFNLFSEQLLLLLYTIYKKIEKLKIKKSDLDEIFQIEYEIEYNTEIFYFQAKKFSSTMRPVSVNSFNKMHYIFQLFRAIDANLNFYFLLLELLIAKDEGNMKIDRATLRNEWAEKVLNLKSTIFTLEKLVWNNFSKKDFYGTFDNIIDWLKIYESRINYGGNKMMNDEIRDLAIKLGSQIGFAAKNDRNPTVGKGKLISMKKSRTLSKFLDQLISFQSRYNLVINKEILTSINEDNFDYFRQFTIISALNSFNFSKKEQLESNGGSNEKIN